jgi:hypothetical protein
MSEASYLRSEPDALVMRKVGGEKPKGWPDKCHNCGAHWSHVGFDYALGFNCRKCGAADSDE